MNGAAIRKGYVDSRWGQLHYREAGHDASLPGFRPLVCLHATAYSSRTFVPIMQALANGRRVIAIDTPGYGESDGPDAPVPFDAYAEAIAGSLRRLVDDEPIDVFGYHTGASIAIEMAAMAARSIERLVLIGIPFFEGSERDIWRAKLVHRHGLEASFDQFAARWDYFITHRTSGLSLERAFECFVDELRVYPRDWWAHASLFEYDARPRLAAVGHPILVINPTGALAEASRAAARVMPHATVVEMPSLTGAIFDLGTAPLASCIDGFLARDRSKGR